MKTLLTLAAFGLFFSASVQAELAPSHQAAIEKLLTVMQVEKQVQANLATGFETGMGATSEQLKSLPQEQQDKFAKGIAKVKAMIMETVTWDKLKPEFIEAYGKHFTEAEANEVIALLSTPAGQLYLSKQTPLAQEVMRVTQVRMKALTPQIMQIIQTEMQ